MRTKRPVRRGACATLILALVATLLGAATPTGTEAVAATTTWRASVGDSGTYGMATLTLDPSGGGTVLLQLLRLPRATTFPVTLAKGACRTAGKVLGVLPAIRTSIAGAGIRTTRLSKTQVAAIRAAARSAGTFAIRVGTGRSATCGVFTPLATQVGLLTRQGGELLLGGAPFHEVSFNKFDLLMQYVFTEHGQWEQPSIESVHKAETALRDLQRHGFGVIRVTASPFYPSWFEDAFFDADAGRQVQKRREFFAAFDQMLDACDRHGIRIVASLVWNWEVLGDLGHHSLHDGMVDRDPLGRQRVEEYVREVVVRYRDRPTIAMWEIGNEWNLGADIQRAVGLFSGSPAGDALHPGPVVRDARNNFTSDELATFLRDIATLIRSADPGHLITTGDSTPRPAAMHLLMAARAGLPVDWTFDSADELTEYLRLTHPDPIDVISIHYADDGMVSVGGTLGSPANLRFFKDAADAIGKPLFVGEIGYWNGAGPWTAPPQIESLRQTLATIVNVKLPLTLYWAYGDDRTTSGGGSLRYGETDAALRLIEDANDEIRE
jgi:hypothetical protein